MTGSGTAHAVTDGTTTTSLLSDLFRAGHGDRAAERRVRDETPLDMTSDVLVEELVFRCGVPAACGTVHLGVAVRSGAARADFVLELVDGADVVRLPATTSPRAMLVEFELMDLVCGLFGPTRAAVDIPAATILAPDRTGEGHPDRDEVRRYGRAMTVVLKAAANTEPDLAGLALRYASDKWGAIHRFTPHYERHLRGLRDGELRVLEIGIGGYDRLTPGGGSLKMWKRYFPRALVFGLDVFDKSHANESRITALLGRQDDPEHLQEVVRRYGPFDVVIDDGSHINGHVRSSFETLFPTVRPGGVYVIEDLWTSYLPGYGGASDPRHDAETSVGLTKSLVDALHHEEHDTPSRHGGSLTGMHVYHNIAFLEKGVNREGGIPGWIPRAPFWVDT